jgi:hypothetical protein
MDKDPTSNERTAVVLREVFMSFLMSPNTERTIIVPVELRDELDADTVTIAHEEEAQRVICHVSRPKQLDQRLRYDSYVVWDDGRSTAIDTTCQLSDRQAAQIRAPEMTSTEIVLSLDALARNGDIGEHELAQLKETVVVEAFTLLQTVKEMLRRPESALLETDGDEVNQMINEHVEKTLSAIANHDISATFEAPIRQMYLEYVRAVTHMEMLTARRAQVLDIKLANAEAIGADPISPEHTYALLGLLDSLQYLH